MATSQKPRKKKPSVSPAEKERRQSYRDQKELHGCVNNALASCRQTFEELEAALSVVTFTPEEEKEFDEIRTIFYKDLDAFQAEVDENDKKVMAAIDEAFKDNKVNIEKKLLIMQDVITYQEITERVLNYMQETENTISAFVERCNNAIKEEALNNVEEAKIVEETKE